MWTQAYTALKSTGNTSKLEKIHPVYLSNETCSGEKSVLTGKLFQMLTARSVKNDKPDIRKNQSNFTNIQQIYNLHLYPSASVPRSQTTTFSWETKFPHEDYSLNGRVDSTWCSCAEFDLQTDWSEFHGKNKQQSYFTSEN